MSYVPDLYTRRQVPSDADALSVRVVMPAGAVSAFGTLVAQPETTVVELQFPYGLLTEHLNLSASNGGYVSSSLGMAVVNAGTVSNGYAALESKAANHYVAGTGGRFKFAGFFVSGAMDSATQEVGIGDSQDGFFFGYSGSLFGVLRRSAGVDNWIPQASWSLDTMDGRGPSGQTLDPTRGNVYQVSYQWLGFGAITYFVEDGSTGMLFPVHRIGYANGNHATSVRDPNLPLRMAVRQWGATGSAAINVSSICAAVEGQMPVHGIRRADQDTVAAVSGEVPAITVLNSGTFNGRPNRMRVRIDSLSIASRDNTNLTQYRLLVNASLGGASFVPASSSVSPVAVDKAATGSLGGREILFVGLGPNGAQVVDLSDYNIRLNPGESLTVTCSGSNSTCLAGLSWIEEL